MVTKISSYTLLLVLAFMTGSVTAKQVYIWVDEHGEKHFTDSKPNGQEVEVRDVGPKEVEATEAETEAVIEPRSLTNMRQAFAHAQQQLMTIYQQALERQPGLAGSIRFRLTIAANGAVLEGEIVNSDFDSRSLNAALLDAVQGFEFGADNVQLTTTTWSMAFAP